LIAKAEGLAPREKRHGSDLLLTQARSEIISMEAGRLEHAVDLGEEFVVEEFAI
jgi:hypothetical protein